MKISNQLRCFFFILVIFLATQPVFCLAQEITSSEEIFEARVLKAMEEIDHIRDGDSPVTQQNLHLIGLTGSQKGKEFDFIGISDLEVVSANNYQVGDRVVVSHSQDIEGNDVFYVLDYVRRPGLMWLLIIFVLAVILVGKWKGVKALISLGVSFIIIMKFIVPKILAGVNPLMIAIVGAFLIILAIVYLTEGVNRKSHLAVLSILLSLIVTAILSILFTNFLKLTGLSQEEAAYLISVGKVTIDFKGLLLAGILIGAIGVLDDVVIGQLESVRQIKKANNKLSKTEVFKRVYQIGNSHLGAAINTLFLAYAGVALPLLLLLGLNQPPFVSFSEVINQEMISVEIVRALVGSIGLVLAIPMATFLGVLALKD